jgi:hypothetical protein
MRESGIFVYKKNLYQYCDKFIKAFEDESYGELIIHSPPLNYLNLLSTPFIFSRKSMKLFSKSLSYFIFWVDNIFIWMNLFLLIEIIISPFVLIKLFLSLFSVIKKMQKRLQYMAMFTIGFPFVFVYVLSIDFRNLFFILRCHQGCKRYNKVKDEIVKKEYSPQLRIKVFNEIRCTLINLFSRLTDNQSINHDMKFTGSEAEREQKQLQFDAEVSKDMTSGGPEFYVINQQEKLVMNFLYVIKKKTIKDEWMKRRFLMWRHQQRLQVVKDNPELEFKDQIFNALHLTKNKKAGIMDSIFGRNNEKDDKSNQSHEHSDEDSDQDDLHRQMKNSDF